MLKGLQHGLELFELKFFHRLSNPPYRGANTDFRRTPAHGTDKRLGIPHGSRAFRLPRERAGEAKSLPDGNARPPRQRENILRPCDYRQKTKRALAGPFLYRTSAGYQPEMDMPYGLWPSWRKTLEPRARQGAEYLLRAYALCPDSPQNCYDLGEAYFKMGKHEEACKFIRKAVETYPGYLEKEDKFKLAEELELTLRRYWKAVNNRVPILIDTRHSCAILAPPRGVVEWQTRKLRACARLRHGVRVPPSAK